MRTNIHKLPNGCSMVIDIKPRHNTVTIKAKKGAVEELILDHAPMPVPVSTCISTTDEKINIQFADGSFVYAAVELYFWSGHVKVNAVGIVQHFVL